jgi:hypothetical protein
MYRRLGYVNFISQRILDYLQFIPSLGYLIEATCKNTELARGNIPRRILDTGTLLLSSCGLLHALQIFHGC